MGTQSASFLVGMMYLKIIGTKSVTALPLAVLIRATFLNAALGQSYFDEKKFSEGEKHMYRKLSVSIIYICLD